MNSEDIALLEAAGWTVECESPFEIRTKDGSFATLEAAYIVLSHVRAETSAGAVSAETSANQTFSQLAASAIESIDDLNGAFTRAVKAYGHDDDHVGWRTLFDLTFSSAPAQKLVATVHALGLTVKWHDPDGSYRDDVSAYQLGLSQLKDELSLLFPPS